MTAAASEPSVPGHSAGQAHARLLCAVAFLDFVDASIVNVALPSIRRRPGLLGAEPAVGAERLPAHLRRLHAARWPGGRPARPPPHAASPGRRSSRSRSLAGGLATSEGMLVGARLVQGVGAAMMAPGRALDPDDDLHRGHRPPQGARRLGGDRRARVRRRRLPRRGALRRTRLALGPLRQHARLRRSCSSARSG